MPKLNKPFTGEMHPKKLLCLPDQPRTAHSSATEGQREQINFWVPKKVNNVQRPESTRAGEGQRAFLLPKVLCPNRRRDC